jgi:hypothetical protein
MVVTEPASNCDALAAASGVASTKLNARKLPVVTVGSWPAV